MLLAASACGTRLDQKEIETAAYGHSTTGGAARAAGPSSGDAVTADAAGPGDATSTTVAAASVAGSTAGGPAPKGATAAAASGAPIVLGQIGTFSGILGAGLIGFKQSAQAWVASVNAKGGINGHPVKLISADDGSDGAKGLAAVKDMVENQHVIAFVASSLVYSGQSIHTYLEQHHIPVVGGDVYDQLWHQSPMLFPQAEFINNLHYATAAGPIQAGKKTFAILTCAEVAACGAARPYQESSIKKLGGRVAYEGQISVAAPDYTAQCVQAHQSGVDVMWVAADGATLSRIANSCARQNYHPAFAAAAGTLDANFATNPNLQGFRGATQVFPWFLTSGSPALQEYGDTMKRYAPSAGLQASTAQGWTSGKLFEKAVSTTIKPGEAPTSDAVLRGLWAIHDETLGGLTSPISFVQNGTAVQGDCSFLVAIDQGKWVAPDGLRLTCGTP